MRNKLQASDTAVFVAEADGRAVGFVEVRWFARTAASAAAGQQARRKGWRAWLARWRKRASSAPPVPSPLEPADFGTVEDIFVTAECRRTGVATDLLAAGLGWLRERGAGEVRAGIWEGNAASLALFGKSGFQVSRLLLRSVLSADGAASPSGEKAARP